MEGYGDLSLFGEMSAEEQAQAEEFRKARQSERQQKQKEQIDKIGEVEWVNSLEFQRQRYLRSNRKDAQGDLNFETLRDREPMNFGQAFSRAELILILTSVNEYVLEKGWTTQRHGAFPTRDVPKDTSVSSMVFGRLKDMLFPLLAKHTGISADKWRFRDLFVIGYHEDHQRALELHSDGCLASLTLLMNDTGEFEGGGTYFEKFDLHIKQEPGDAWIHDAKLSHSGVSITRGSRIVMVAFMDTAGGFTGKHIESKFS
ncbi:hypothetical protein GGI25_001228 [Coemansia spiralis]|uniref:Fe2OG dioxygenase domain-containing protein n=2 Tax=Coemansia TaxID=4863 RepID=A0A9W8KYM9_9FUNG|nr:hypothetical protein EDC05_001301 [Coemansia umbellata]KAJ2679777.1 hypothetical protein GGI25_001228 [Coemansia spiralis]